MLNINKTAEDGNLVYALEGRLDTISSPTLENDLRDELADANSLTLDLAGLDYISSAGLRVLLTAWKAMSGKGDMKLLNVNETVMEILEVTGFSDLLTIE